MSATCKTCKHPERTAIDRAIVSRSESAASIARRFGLSKASVTRHIAHGHLAQDLALAQAVVVRAAERAAGSRAPRLNAGHSPVVAGVVEQLEEEGRRAIDLQAEWNRVSRDLERLADACRRALEDDEGRFRPPVTEGTAAAAVILVRVATARQRGLTIAGRMIELLSGDDDAEAADLSQLTLEELEVLTGRR